MLSNQLVFRIVTYSENIKTWSLFYFVSSFTYKLDMYLQNTNPYIINA